MPVILDKGAQLTSSCAPICFMKRKNLTNPFTIRLEFRTFELVRFGRSTGIRTLTQIRGRIWWWIRMVPRDPIIKNREAFSLSVFYGRSDGIRTHDLLVPNQAHYQTVPHPEIYNRAVRADDASNTIVSISQNGRFVKWF